MSAVTKPGVYFDMDVDLYHSDPTPNGSLSSSWARKLMEPAGPAKFIHERRNSTPPKRVFEFGHAAHTLVLGAGAPVVEIPRGILSGRDEGIRSDEAKEWVAQAQAEGKMPLKPAKYAVVEAMAAKLREHPEAMEALTADGTRTEASAFHIDPETGMWLRGRFDAISPTGIVDYKTIVDADPRRFGRRTAHELGYHQQAAWYLNLANKLGLTDGPFRFVLQEKKAPYLVSVVELEPVYLSIGEARNRAAIDLYARCLAADEWPGYTGVAVVEAPMWLASEDPSTLPDDLAAQLAAYADQLAKETVS